MSHRIAQFTDILHSAVIIKHHSGPLDLLHIRFDKD